MHTGDIFSLDSRPVCISLCYFPIWSIILTGVYRTNIMMNVIGMILMTMTMMMVMV